MKKRKHPLDFPGSQAAVWNCLGDCEVVELCEWKRDHGGSFAVYDSYASREEKIPNIAYAYELTPIGPVARALLRVK